MKKLIKPKNKENLKDLSKKFGLSVETIKNLIKNEVMIKKGTNYYIVLDKSTNFKYK